MITGDTILVLARHCAARKKKKSPGTVVTHPKPHSSGTMMLN
jgi:hypothetical protein